MALTRREPTSNLLERDLFPRRFSDVLDEFFNDAVATNRDSFVPGVDITETDDAYQVTVELPGMKKDDINISLENNQLTVSGERKFKNEDKNKKYHRVESRFGKFSRTFTLPQNVDEESINAKYEDGLLKIAIQKAEDKVSKKIEIQ